MLTEQTLAFLAPHGWAEATLSALEESGASHRQYRRLTRPDSATAILVFVHDVEMELKRFSALAGIFRELGFSAPEVYAADETAKLMLIEDFGDQSYARMIAGGADRAQLHGFAVEVLLALQERFDVHGPLAQHLLRYDFALWQKGLENFYLHYLPCTGSAPLSAAEQAEFWRLWHGVLDPTDAWPRTILMRDFKPPNLMHLPDRAGLKACGLLDFQDAGIGAPLYDLVELCQSWRQPIPDEVRDAVIDRYAAGRPAFDRATIMSGVMGFGAVRWISWLSTCARYAREGRTQFLANIPGIWAAAEACFADPALAELGAWFRQYAPTAQRAPQQVAA